MFHGQRIDVWADAGGTCREWLARPSSRASGWVFISIESLRLVLNSVLALSQVKFTTRGAASAVDEFSPSARAAQFKNYMFDTDSYVRMDTARTE